MTTPQQHDAEPSHHERHHRTLAQTRQGQDRVDGAESISSSRSASSSDDEPAQGGTTDDTSHAHDGAGSKSTAYDIKLHSRSADPIADSQNLDPDELPSHWVPTVMSQVTRATSTAFGSLGTPRQSTSSRDQQQQQHDDKEESHILPRLTFCNPWEQSFRKPGIKGILGGGLKWGLPDSYTEGSGRNSKRSSGFKSSKKIQKQLEMAKREDRELGENWDKVEVVEPDWGWPSGHLKEEVDELRREDRDAHPSQAKQDEEKKTKVKGSDADYKAKEKPLRDWSDPKTSDRAAARVTWLGHASTLLQLPPLSTGSNNDEEEEAAGRSINILFDPIFSERCSPSQSAGPQRFTPAPCSVKDLPPIDFVIISHSHYDHLDYHTFKQLHHRFHDKIHAFVPLGVKDKLTGNGGFGWHREQVSELDWWDHAQISKGGAELNVHCTPAQHGSGRGAGDKDASLWASWVVEWKGAQEQRFCAFFAGDTGLKYHHDNPHKRAKYPACPAFAEIANKFQPFDLLLLPISVGSSLSYFRSWDPFPRAFSPFPRVSSTLTSSIHMDPQDAVECHRIFAHQQSGNKLVSLAVHYGTFVRNDEQTRGDVRELRKACGMAKLKFVRVRDGTCLLKGGKEAQMEEEEQERLKGEQREEGDVFCVADQGRTVWLPIGAE